MTTAPKRILMAKTGLDGHWRGPTIVARALRDAGFEVIMVGMVTADEVVRAAIDEDVDLVGLIKQGVLTPGRVQVLMSPGDSCFRGYGRRNGERRRKSVRGCIVSPDLSVLNLVIVKKGEQELPGLTDEEKPRMRGPKRASKVRKQARLLLPYAAATAQPGAAIA